MEIQHLSENVVITATTTPEFLTLTDNGDHTATLTGTPLQDTGKIVLF